MILKASQQDYPVPTPKSFSPHWGQDWCPIVTVTLASDPNIFEVRDQAVLWAKAHPRRFRISGHDFRSTAAGAIGRWMVVQVQDGQPKAYFQGTGISGPLQEDAFDTLPNFDDARVVLGSAQFFQPAFFLHCEEALFEVMRLNRLDDGQREACGLLPRTETVDDIQVAFFCYIPEPGDPIDLAGPGDAETGFDEE
jgi:hypothetical protein